MTSAEIRQSYLDFFRSKNHTIVSSSSLMPDSPNLLFTNAGMNQFVPIFLGESSCPYKPGRAVDTQKCIRAGGKHNDLEDVGLDTYHHTFFEMLGNWSFGDYFKKEAIEWAWELIVGVWKFPAERVYATVYKPGPGDPATFDQEAYDAWSTVFKKAGLDPAVHIVNGNKKDNFWMMGDTGPCGPCSELHIDLTPHGDGGPSLVNSGSPKCIEIWNLVFIQFNAGQDGSFSPLPARHVDTGMGFERVCSIIQGTNGFKDFKNARISNYETDVFSPLFRALEELSGLKYGSTLPSANGAAANEQEKRDIAFRVIADHIRTLSFSIADGILPSNEGRGYVLRRILRRAVRYGRELGLRDLFFHKLVKVLGAQLGDVFPELRQRLTQVEEVIQAEENSFSSTLDNGIERFRETAAKSRETFPGDEAFKLYDTYGFPVDLTDLMAREAGLKVDVPEFERLMNEQKQRSRASQKKEIIEVTKGAQINFPTEFVGYEKKEAVLVENCHVETIPATKPGEKPRARLFLSPTPFYGEMGGQVGDTGVLEFNGKMIPIHDTQRVGHDVIFQISQDTDAVRALEFPLYASVDIHRRALIEAHHSVTHIMHWALRNVLGTTVQQKGSYVGPDRLRFDFSHMKAMTPEEIRKVEEMVNEKIALNSPVSWKEKPYTEVKGDPTILQFFGDKYGEVVRVVDIGGYSKELCGGTHVTNTSAIGFFRLVSEGAIAAGIRRIEAICGDALIPYMESEFQKLNARIETLRHRKPDLVAQTVKISEDATIEGIWNILEERRKEVDQLDEAVREWEKAHAKEREAGLVKQANEVALELLGKATDKNGTPLITADLGEQESALLQHVVDSLKRQWTGVIVLASHRAGKVALMASVHPSLTSKIQAGKIIQTLAPVIGGKGGGKPELAQGGGSKPEAIAEALSKVETLL